jgi:branched-chain amino acid transport system permease protein
MKSSSNRTVLLAVVLVAAGLLPMAVTVPYFLHLIILGLIWVIMAQGQNLIQGFTGYVSIAQAGFMGIGAYASTILSVKLGWPVWITMALAPFITAVFAVFVGYPSLRVKGHYFAIVTLAYNMVIYIVLNAFGALTGGEAGIAHVPRPPDIVVGDWAWRFDGRVGYYYLVLIAAVMTTALCAAILHSRVGRVLVAIRQNEPLVEGLGVSSWRYKLFAFVTSASMAGLAGALYAHFIGFLNPDPFGIDSSLNAILAVIFGGSGTLAGPVVGAFAVVFLPEYLRVAENYRLVTYGLVLVVATIFMPRGLVPMVVQGARAVLAKLRSPTAAAAPLIKSPGDSR